VLIGYLYGITSERKLVEELRMHLAWRWFTGLGFDQEIPHHSTFSKNRHRRFQESKLFGQLFEQIVKQRRARHTYPTEWAVSSPNRTCDSYFAGAESSSRRAPFLAT
jgi:transposase